MIGLDTNILARYYVEDETDSESLKQREAAQRLIESGEPLMVCKTVILEFEWVMRGYYRFKSDQIAAVLHHLISLPNIHLEERGSVENSLTNYANGLDFSDALHHAAYSECDSMASFDDRKFSKRVKRLGLKPRVFVPD
jgi:predicted nucleic-acid-binding protein